MAKEEHEALDVQFLAAGRAGPVVVEHFTVTTDSGSVSPTGSAETTSSIEDLTHRLNAFTILLHLDFDVTGLGSSRIQLFT